MSAAEKKTEEAKPRSLITKLAEVMGEVERIAKNGRNTNHNYDYATEADITAAVRAHMAERHLMLMPNVEKTEWDTIGATAKGVPRKLCTLTVKFTLVDGDSGEERSFIILGQGEDTGDKATYKAMTGALKYALLKLFMIPTGDDPENDSEHRYTPGSNAPSPAERQASAPVPADSPTVPFGKMKGKRLSEIPDPDLEYHLKAAAKAVDLKDPKWGAKNEAWLRACQEEASRRVFPAEGKKEAPKTTSPKTGEPDVWALISDLAKQHGLSGQAAASRIRGATGKTDRKALTMVDYESFRASLVAVPPTKTTPNGRVESEPGDLF